MSLQDGIIIIIIACVVLNWFGLYFLDLFGLTACFLLLLTISLAVSGILRRLFQLIQRHD